MQVELLEAKTETLRPFGAAEVAAMSAATSPGTGLAYGLGGSALFDGECMARSLVLRMTSGQHAEQPRQSVGDQARDLGPGAAGGDRSRPGRLHRPGRARRYRKVGEVCRDIRVARKRVLRLMRGTTLLSPHAAAAVAAIPMTVRSSLMPRTSCGAPMAFGCSRWTTAGADLHRRRALERRVCRLACLQARRPLRRPAADLRMGLADGCYDRGRRGSGAGEASSRSRRSRSAIAR